MDMSKANQEMIAKMGPFFQELDNKLKDVKFQSFDDALTFVASLE
jgi:hypothetical protein